MAKWVVGLTGGIGSGKSTASEIFSTLGIEVVDCDVISRAVTAPHSDAFKTIVDRFGQAIVLDEQLNRKALGQIIFAHPSEKRWLEHLTHPLIIQESLSQIASSSSPYVVWVIPLLVEHFEQFKPHLNRILVIDLDEEHQKKRTLHRDHIDDTLYQQILSTQAPRAKRIAMGDDVIHNQKTPEYLKQEVLTLHPLYLKLSAKTCS